MEVVFLDRRSAGGVRWWSLHLVVLAVSVPALLGCEGRRGPVHGASVVCRPGGVAVGNGLASGDVVVAWRRGGAVGSVSSWFDLWVVEKLEAPRGPVVLTVARGGRAQEVTLPTGLWEIEARPRLSRSAQRLYAEAKRLTEDGEHEKALRTWQRLAEQVRHVPANEAWCSLQGAVSLQLLERAAEAERALDRATELLEEPAGGAATRAVAAEMLADLGRMREAEALYARAAELCEAVGGDPALLAHALMGLAWCDMRSGGQVARRAHHLFEELQHDSLETAAARALMASHAFYQSDLDAAERGYRAALATARRRAPGSGEIVKYLSNLGLVAMKRGDLDAARDTCLEALQLVSRLDPGGRNEAFTVNYLGLIAKNMGRFGEARRWYERALATFRDVRPGGDEVAGVLNNLGNVALRLGDLSAARAYHEEALALRERLRPKGAEVASSLNNLGEIARQKGDLESARSYLERVVELKRELAPGTLWLASSLRGLGEVARLEGRMRVAGSLHREALRIERSVLPGGLGEASSLICLGQTAEAQGRLSEAEVLWREAIRLIEAHRNDLGLLEDDRSVFGAPFYWVYVRLAGLLVHQGRDEEAFALLERARARAFRSAISDRLPSGVPAAQRSAWRRLQRAERAAHRRLTTLDGERAGDEIAALRRRLRSIAAERHDLVGEIQEVDPRFGAFALPRALTLAQVRAALEPGSVLLLYSVGETETVVFALAPEGNPLGWEGRSVRVDKEELARRVDVLRAFIARGRVVEAPDTALLHQAQVLSRLLLNPVRRFVERADRVVIAPDGVLLDLPFAALRTDWSVGGAWLGERTALCCVPSATAFVQLHEKPRGSAVEGLIEVFAEPEIDPELRRRYELRPLEWASDEAASIAELFGDRARLHRGRRADEATVRGLGSAPSIIHFAAHAVLDARQPLESALLLAPSAEFAGEAGDGALTAWEVMGGGGLSADVVILSACETARGATVDGEGVMGLARAFHYAGARTVVASSWEVPDRSTYELMLRFYENLANGRPTAEALWRARAALAAAPVGCADGSTVDLRHPYHWAAFRVIGDCL